MSKTKTFLTEHKGKDRAAKPIKATSWQKAYAKKPKTVSIVGVKT